MKIKSGFTLRQVAGNYILMDIGGELNFHGMITLNETGAFILKAIEEGLSEEEIGKKLSEEYDIDFETAMEDTKSIISKMQEAGIIE